jgi:hypothetical protein
VSPLVALVVGVGVGVALAIAAWNASTPMGVGWAMQFLLHKMLLGLLMAATVGCFAVVLPGALIIFIMGAVGATEGMGEPARSLATFPNALYLAVGSGAVSGLVAFGGDKIWPLLGGWDKALSEHRRRTLVFLGHPEDGDFDYPEEWDDIRRAVFARDGYQCRNCKASGVELHCHHVVPLSRGGETHPDNLVTLCAECHARVHPHLER